MAEGVTQVAVKLEHQCQSLLNLVYRKSVKHLGRECRFRIAQHRLLGNIVLYKQDVAQVFGKLGYKLLHSHAACKDIVQNLKSLGRSAVGKALGQLVYLVKANQPHLLLNQGK